MIIRPQEVILVVSVNDLICAHKLRFGNGKGQGRKSKVFSTNPYQVVQSTHDYPGWSLPRQSSKIEKSLLKQRVQN